MRTLKRFLDYGKRVRRGQGLDELGQWVGRILLDEGPAYSLEDMACAFEIAALEAVAAGWPHLVAASADPVVVAGPIDRTLLYRQILAPEVADGRRRAFLDLLAARTKGHWAWIRDRAATSAGDEIQGDGIQVGGLFAEFLLHLSQIDPLDLGHATTAAEVEELRHQVASRRTEAAKLREYLEESRDRVEASHQRVAALDEETKRLREALREETDNAEKLRAERSRRIRSERGASESSRDLAKLKREYLRLEQRLQQMAQRVSVAESHQAGPTDWLDSLRSRAAEEILGLQNPVTEDKLVQARRRLAATFHPDRLGHHPAWVAELFAQLLGLVNDACDRLRR